MIASDEGYTDEVEMPADCSECGGVWDLNSLARHPDGRLDALVCPPCNRSIRRALAL